MLHFPSSKQLCHTHLIHQAFKRQTPVKMPVYSGFPVRIPPSLSADSQMRSCQCHLSRVHPLAPLNLTSTSSNCWDPMVFTEGFTHIAEGFHCQEEQPSSTMHRSIAGLDLGSLVLSLLWSVHVSSPCRTPTFTRGRYKQQSFVGAQMLPAAPLCTK